MTRWRNWRLSVKLGAVLFVPALIAVAAGALTIHDDVTRSNSYTSVQRMGEMRDGLDTLVGDLQAERALAVKRLGGIMPVTDKDLDRHSTRVDRAESAFKEARRRAVQLDEASDSRYQEATRLLGGLPELRREVASSDVSVWASIKGYNLLIDALLDLDEALANQFIHPELARLAHATHDLTTAHEQIYLQHVLLLELIRQDNPLGSPLATGLQRSEVRFDDSLADFRAVTTEAEQDRYEWTVSGYSVENRARLLRDVLSEPRGTKATDAERPAVMKDWDDHSMATGNLMGEAKDSFVRKLAISYAQLQESSSNKAGTHSVLLLAALLLALGIGSVIGRFLLRSVDALHSTALDVAERRLPAVVASIHEGHVHNTPVETVPVHTTEELGQLARAFDAVHSQAVRLAGEQAALRGDLRNTLVNLSRRSQSLVERQLRLMEQLERKEEDPDQLSDLFLLDHLATRMRRNNENLLILSGEELARPFHRPESLGTVLQAAVSEIEHYKRATVLPAPSVEVMGYATGDVARLIAELLDNATAFSPPSSEVVVSSSRQYDGAVLVEIVDQGIGMNGPELAEANRRVMGDSSVEVPTSRQMGLFVVGRLAQRNGIQVTLSADPHSTGLRSVVRVPAELVRADPAVGSDDAGQARNALVARSSGTVAARRTPAQPSARAKEPSPAPGPRDPKAPSLWFHTLDPDDSGATNTTNGTAAPHRAVRPGDAGEQDTGRRENNGADARPEAPRAAPGWAPVGDGTYRRTGEGRPLPPVGAERPFGPPPAATRPTAPSTRTPSPSAPATPTPVNGVRSTGRGLERRPDGRAEARPEGRPEAGRTPAAPPLPVRQRRTRTAGARGPRPSIDHRSGTKPIGIPVVGTPESRPVWPKAPERPPFASPPINADELEQTAAGLPKRTRRVPSNAPSAPPEPAAESIPPDTPDAKRTQSFLSSYQAGIRRAQPANDTISSSDKQE